MDNVLARKLSFSSLLVFALPNIIMMISLSMYIIIDGMFVSRLIGTTALSAVNMFYGNRRKCHYRKENGGGESTGGKRHL